jgi:HD-GYP domain-containing protein (c-di-GMP phosphodiesterase class II)
VAGRRLLEELGGFPETVRRLVSDHHERLDGTGYPLGLADHQIRRETRIITVCDYYDALTSDRPYRAAMPVEDAMAIIAREVGGAIDSDCFEALRTIV